MVGALKPDRIEPPRGDLSQASIGQDLLVFARELNDGYGDYDDSVITIVKEFRLAGADASFEHGPERRRWIGENAVDPTVLELIVGIGSNAAWAALCALVSRRKSDHVRVQWGQWEEASGELQWFEAEGSGDAVAAAIEAARPTDEEGARPKDEP